MAALLPDLYSRCRSTLLQCSEFNSNASLKTVFITDELFPFSDDLPEPESTAERVEQCLTYLLPKRLSDNRLVLPLFIEALRDRYHEGDALRDKLGNLAHDVSQALTASASSSASSSQNPGIGFSETITWLHLSDLHFRESRAYDENIVLRALLRDVTERIESDRLQPDFVVVTGDLAFSGQPSEYDLARKFFDELMNQTGLPKDRLFTVPGNHDVNRKLITGGAEAIGVSLTDRNKVNKLLVTPDDRRLILSRFKGYGEFVNDYFETHLKFDDEHYFYVNTLELDGVRIALLGLNAAWLAASDEDKAQGLVLGERQIRAALDAAHVNY